MGNNSFGTWKRDLLASLKEDGLARYVLEQVPRTEADFEDGNNVVRLYISSSIDKANRAHLATAREMYSTLEQLHGGANRLLTFQQAWQDLITLKPPVGAGKKTFLDDFRKLQNKLADAAASLDDDKAKYAVPDPLIAMQLLSSLPKPESNALVSSILAEHSNKLGSFSSASVYSRLQLELHSDAATCPCFFLFLQQLSRPIRRRHVVASFPLLQKPCLLLFFPFFSFFS